jgi:cell division protein ZapB
MTRMKALYPSTGRRAKTIDAANSVSRPEYRPRASPFTPAGKLLSDRTERDPMEHTDLQALMGRLELLIERVEQLKRENGLLLAQEKTWREERAHLIEKNEIARRKVESMISRLKALEQDS